MRLGGGRNGLLGALLAVACLAGAACTGTSTNDSVEAIDADGPEATSMVSTSRPSSTLNVAAPDRTTSSAVNASSVTTSPDTASPDTASSESAGSTTDSPSTPLTPGPSTATIKTATTTTTAEPTNNTATNNTATNNTATNNTATSDTDAATNTTTKATTASVDQGGQLHVRASAPAGGDGSAQKPFATLEAGIRAVGPGETVVVHGGEYRERINIGSGLAPGTATAPITITAAPGERPVVRGKLWLRRMSYWTINGINVTWDSERNTSNEHMVSFAHGTNWTYQNSEVWGARSYAGVLVGGDAVNWTLRGLHIHDTYPTNDTNQDHLIYCNCGSGGGLIERNLLVGSKNGRAIKVGTVGSGDTNISNVTIRYNTMVDNTGPSNVQLSYRTSGVVIERNVFVGVKSGRANVTTHELAGSGNVVRDNVGWESVGVVEADSGLRDGGGNLHLDPALNGDYRPTTGAANGYGHRAGG